MPFPERARYSLRLRVAISSAVTAAVVGLGAAAIATWLVSELSASAEDQRLRDIAMVMKADLDDPRESPDESVEDEAREVAPLGVRIAFFEHGVRRAGSAFLRNPPREGCFAEGISGSVWRICALGEDARRIVVAAPSRGSGNSRTTLLLSIAGAAALAALTGALASGALAGWALSPLTSLNTRLEHVTSAAPGRSDLGDPSGASEVEALRGTLRALLGRLGDALEQSRGFAANAAHELRTPLALMMAELDLAAERAPAVASELARVRRTVSRLAKLVERLLALASAPSSLSHSREAVALEDVVRDVLGTYDDAQRSRVSATFDAPGMVRGDDELLRVVIDNLLENALKFDATGAVRVAVTEDAGVAIVVVSDEGPGIEAAEWPRLLRPFERGNVGAKGHGLGLAIASHVVRLHEGELALVPSASGAQIRITLPGWKKNDESEHPAC